MAKKNLKSKPATRRDIDKLERQIKQRATHRDLELWGGQLQDQLQEFQQSMQRQFEKMFERLQRAFSDSQKALTEYIDTRARKTEQNVVRTLDDRIEAYTEHRAEELLGVKGDEVRLIQDRQIDHERRIQVVEKKVGIS